MLLVWTSAIYALTFGDASSIWSLQRNRETGVVECVPNANGFTTKEVTTRIMRNADNPSLGIALEELGATEDAGLVLVDSCVEGGNAAAASPAPILPGDVLVSVATTGNDALNFRVEGLNYDATIEALSSLDPSKPVELTLRRLERVARVAVTLQFPPADERPDETLELLAGMPLRRSILSQGIKLNDPLAVRFDAGWGTGDCGGEGTCCTCALEVVEGAEALTEAQAQERQMLRKHPNWRLACRAAIADVREDTELVLRVAPRQLDEEEGEEDFMAGERV